MNNENIPLTDLHVCTASLCAPCALRAFKNRLTILLQIMDLEHVRFTPLPGTLLDGSSGLEAHLIVETKQSFVPPKFPPEKLLATIRQLEQDQKGYFFFWKRLFASELEQTASRISSLRECDTCLVDRVSSPRHRMKTEEMILTYISDVENLHLVMFGDAGMFQTMILVEKIRHAYPQMSIHVHSIDPRFGHLTRHKENPPEMNLFARRVSQFLSRLPFVKLYLYEDVSRYLASEFGQYKETPKEPTICVAIDYLDELGIIGEGRSIQADLLWLKLFLPKQTIIVELTSVFGIKLMVTRKTNVEVPFRQISIAKADEKNDDRKQLETFMDKWLNHTMTKEDMDVILPILEVIKVEEWGPQKKVAAIH